MKTYKVTDGTVTYVVHVPDDTTPKEIAQDFVRGYDTNGEPVTDVDMEVMDEDGDVLYSGTLDIVDGPSEFDFIG